LFGIAIAAINRAAFGGLEGDLGLRAAIGAGDRMHLAGSAAEITISRAATGSSASGAAAGVILKTMGLIELLFTNGKDELL